MRLLHEAGDVYYIGSGRAHVVVSYGLFELDSGEGEGMGNEEDGGSVSAIVAGTCKARLDPLGVPYIAIRLAVPQAKEKSCIC